ncbi:MAG: 4-hydroxyphenylacetate 3-hydroxylase C-terminal domain-containing protein, partial [Candidatus Methanomethylicia archaeon]
DIAGGIGETGCMPYYADFKDSRIGKYIEKYLKTTSTAESRMRAARLVEWVTMGAGVPGCMHGGGSPYTARAAIGSLIDFKEYVGIGKYLAGIEEDIIASCEEILKRKGKV